jgi:putative membrane protein insertion efficiency factor
MSKLMIILIRGYQYFISPMLGQRCKYYPSCSNYTLEAIKVHGPFKGVALGAWRLLRCNPFSNGGFDPVPPRKG